MLKNIFCNFLPEKTISQKFDSSEGEVGIYCIPQPNILTPTSHPPPLYYSEGMKRTLRGWPMISDVVSVPGSPPSHLCAKCWTVPSGRPTHQWRPPLFVPPISPQCAQRSAAQCPATVRPWTPCKWKCRCWWWKRRRNLNRKKMNRSDGQISCIFARKNNFHPQKSMASKQFSQILSCPTVLVSATYAIETDPQCRGCCTCAALPTP